MKNTATLPGIDLHCHLDGSLNPQFMQRIINAKNGTTLTLDAITEQVQVPENCPDLATYLKRFDMPIQAMHTASAVEEGAYLAVKSLADDGVDYAELRFAPSLFVNPDLTERQTLEATLAGFERGSAHFGVVVGTIICAMRHFPLEKNMASYQLARDYLHSGVCAVDLAGDEAAFPTRDFADLFAKAKALDLPFTIHAGECGNPQNIQHAIDFGASRIGHGIAMAGNAPLQGLCAAKQIGVELCPVSNQHTKAVGDMRHYPLLEFLSSGVLATINTDNRTVSNTTLKREFATLDQAFALTFEQRLTLTQNAIACAFASDDVKQMLWTKLPK